MGLEEIQRIKSEAGQIKPKKVYAIPKQSKKKIAQIKAEKEAFKVGGGNVTKIALDKWFYDIAEKHSINGRGCACMECGEWISHDYLRHATAHLLAKKLFKSVATHELNYLILGAGCGCHEKSHRVDKFVQMKVWDEAARRIKIMMPLLPFDELRYISNQLLIALDNT
jgi:hypothetical protein